MLAFRIFYREKIIINEDRASVPKPSIIVSNHPSTLTDPVHVGGIIKNTHPHFLINAGLVQHWFTDWFFNTFYCIPIARAKDTGDRKVDNENSFERVHQHLEANGTIYIAPEGVSNMDRRLQPLKTGLARIALSTEQEYDFKMGLKIQPFGLNYTGQRFFRSSVIINCGEPFGIEKYQEAYQTAPRETVKALMEELAERMRELILHTTDNEEDQMLLEVGQAMQAAYPLDLKHQFFRSQKNLKKIQELRQEDGLYEAWQKRVATLSEKLRAKKTDHQSLFAVANNLLTKRNNKKSIGLFFGLPFFLYGWINNFLPNFIPGFLAKKLNLYKGYDPAVKILSGIVLYPIFYGLQLLLVKSFFGSWWACWFYFLSLYPLGVFAWNYRQRFLNWKKERNMIRWKKENPKEVQHLFTQQEEITNTFASQ